MSTSNRVHGRAMLTVTTFLTYARNTLAIRSIHDIGTVRTAGAALHGERRTDPPPC